MEETRRDLAKVLEGLSIIAVGTRSDGNVPVSMHAVGLEVGPGSRVTVFVAEAPGAETFANLEANGAVAVVLERPMTHRTVQLKGRCVELRPAREDERPIVERSLAAFGEDVGAVGAPAMLWRRIRRWPCRAITVEVREVYEQTPGPRAGLPLESGGAA
jgi:hypothetical protein